MFICEELQSPAILPVFLTPADLAATWEKAGRPKEELPDGITMMDLRMLVAQVRATPKDLGGALAQTFEIGRAHV